MTNSTTSPLASQATQDAAPAAVVIAGGNGLRLLRKLPDGTKLYTASAAAGEAHAKEWKFNALYADTEVRSTTDDKLLAVVLAGDQQRHIVNLLKRGAVAHAIEPRDAAPTKREQEADAELLVACVTLNGATLTVEASALADIFGTDDEQHTYALTFKRMTRAAYETLGEFNGF